MSISNRHSVVPFVAGKSVAMADQRLAKVGYKSTKQTKAKFPSVCASVPMIADDQIIPFSERLLPHVRTLLENAQDGILRSLYESNDGNLASVSDDEISIQACISFLEADAAGSRLTKEMVEKWFDETLSGNVYVLIAEKLGFTDPNKDQDVLIQKHVAGYKGVLASLSGGKTLLQPVQIKGCKVALESMGEMDDLAQKLMNRLTQMEAKPVMADLLEL